MAWPLSTFVEVDKVAMTTADFVLANHKMFGIVDFVQTQFL